MYQQNLAAFSQGSEQLEGNGIRTRYNVKQTIPGTQLEDNLEIVQDIRVVGSNFQTSAVQITTRVTNLATTPARVGIRYLWDFQLGADDGPALAPRHPDGDNVATEVEYIDPSFAYFRIQDNDSNPNAPILSVLGTVNTPNVFNPPSTRPSLLRNACWGDASETPFDYTINPQREINTTTASDCNGERGGDGAVLYYFGHDSATAHLLDAGQDTYEVTAYIFLELPVSSNTVDTDGDGLLDSWETLGIDFNNDGVIDVPAPAGLSPTHKDILIYYDWTLKPDGSSNKPQQESLDRVIAAFANAPVTNPDGTTGIKVHFKEGMQVSDGDDGLLGLQVNDSYSWEEFAGIKAASFPAELWPYYHYSIFATQYWSNGSSGLSRNGSDFGGGSSDFMVTIGSWGLSGEDLIRIEASTLMHELGHNLGLGHGGAAPENGQQNPDYINRKPNYLSIMSYSFQMTGIPTTAGNILDYSRFGSSDFQVLDESALKEDQALAINSDLSTYSTKYYCPQGSAAAAQSNVPLPRETVDTQSYVIFTVPLTATSIDWNCDGQISTDTAVSANINADWGDQVQSNDDWKNIVYTGGAIGSLGVALNLPLTTDVSRIYEPTVEDYQAMQAGYLQVVTPAVAANGETCVTDVALDTGLSDAINAANAGTGCSTIRLTADIVLGQSPTLYPSEFGDNAFPLITGTVVIDGNGHSISRTNESPAFRFFYVRGRDGNLANLTLTNMRLTGGQSVAGGAILVDGSQGGNASLTVVQVEFVNNSSPGGNGGAVATHSLNGGIVNTTFDAVSFTDNSASYGGGFYSGGFDGGQSISTMINASFQNNRAEQSGGAIYNNGGGANAVAELTTTQSVFAANSALTGGAIHDNGTNGGRSNIRLNSTTFRDNSAQLGDTIFSDGRNGLVDLLTSESVGAGGGVAHCFNDDNGLLTYSGECN